MTYVRGEAGIPLNKLLQLVFHHSQNRLLKRVYSVVVARSHFINISSAAAS